MTLSKMITLYLMVSMLYKGQVCIPTNVASLHGQCLIHHWDPTKIDSLDGSPDGNVNHVGGGASPSLTFLDLLSEAPSMAFSGGEEEGEVEWVKDETIC